jgi:hypothetical protein
MKTITARQNNIQIVKDAANIEEISKGFSPDKNISLRLLKMKSICYGQAI